MPTIAQQDYIYIPMLDGGELPEEIPQEIQNRLVQLAQDGRALDVVLTEGNANFPPSFMRIITIMVVSAQSVNFAIFDIPDASFYTFNCTYQEITNEPDAQEENHADAQ